MICGRQISRAGFYGGGVITPPYFYFSVAFLNNRVRIEVRFERGVTRNDKK